MSLWMKHLLWVAVVAGFASLLALALFWWTGSRRTAAVAAAVTTAVAVILGSRRISSVRTAVRG